MGRKKGSFTKKFVIVACCLIVVQLVLIGIFSVETPQSFPEEMAKKVATDPRIPPERRALVQLHLALRDYRAQHGAFPNELAQLVPAYFPKVPIDPQTAEPFKYTVDKDRYYLGDPAQRAKAAGDDASTGDAKTKQGQPSPNADKEEQAALLALLNAESPEDEFTYSSSGKRDPFRSFDFSPRQQAASAENPLESYSYDDLKLTAVLETGGEPTAIIENPKGKGYMVKVGAKIGNMGGKIVKIEPDRVIIVETTVEFTGEAKNREVEMFLR